VAGASHELRTPLTTTRTLLEIPLTQGRVPADLEPTFHGALAANERSEHLIAALLALARAGQPGGNHPAVQAADLNWAVTAALEEQAPALAKDKLALTRPTGQPAAAAADPDLVLIAVSNLLSNAIRHNRPGGRIEIRTGSDQQTAWLEVANDGPDLTGADLDQLTEPFQRGTQTRLSGEGLGMGLALVQTIATSHGGRLTLAAREPGGLQVRLAFPAANPTPQAAPNS
jgi:signal transduction histidine kinase